MQDADLLPGLADVEDALTTRPGAKMLLRQIGLALTVPEADRVDATPGDTTSLHVDET